MQKPFKIAQSVLVLIHTAALDVLLLRRADVAESDGPFWQSVTGSKDSDEEDFRHTAQREVAEETGIDCAEGSPLGPQLQDWQLENVYPIYPRWLHRYAPGVWRNTEHVFGLQVPSDTPVRLSPREHVDAMWLPYREAADRCFSPSNAEACLMLPRFLV